MAAEAARREVHFVDAPVTGSAPTAAEAKLIFGWELIRPTWKEFVRYCSAWATRLFIPADTALGPPVKMVVNLLLGNAMAAFAEGMALGEGLGISRKALFDSLLDTPAVAPFLKSKRAKIESGKLRGRVPAALDAKGYASRISERVNQVWPCRSTNVAKEIYRLAMRDGHDTEDFSAVYEFTMGGNRKERRE